MDKTYLDYFNYYLVQFENDLLAQFPFTKDGLLTNYRPLLEGNDKKNDVYVKFFVAKVNNHLTHIGKKDESMFSGENVLMLLEGVDFNQIWNSEEATPNNKQAIWKYLQLLTILGRKVIPNKDEVIQVLNQVGGVINTPSPVEMKQGDGDDEPEVSGLESVLDMAGNATKLASMFGLGGAGGSGGTGDMMKGLTDMLSNPQGLMEKMGLDMDKMKEAVESMGQGLVPEEDNTSDENEESGDNTDTNPSNDSNPMNEFAKTLESIGLDTSDPNPNMMDVMSKLVSSGKLPELMKTTSNLVGKMTGGAGGGLENMMKNLMGGQQSAADLRQAAEATGQDRGQQNRVREATRNLATRDRLRAKLAAKNELKNK